MDIEQCSRQVEEVSRRYAQRNGIERDDAWFMLTLHEEVGELTQAYLMKTGQARHKGLTPAQIEAGFRSELADVLGQVLLLARRHDVDLEAAVHDKWLVWLPDDASDSGQTPPDMVPSH
jgi:NTP pyrophosphatase (non-canonical NTP hydrolase)